MTKRKSVLFIIFTVLVLVLSIAMLVACNEEQTPAVKYTITFDDGSGQLKTAEVEQGKSLTADQIPAPATIEGFDFGGWYVGETLLEAGYTPTADVTVTARYVKKKVVVSFKDGDTVIDSIEIDYDTAIEADDIPAGPSKTAYRFLGWYDGETKFASDMKFKANVTFTAKFERTGYVLTLTFAPAEKDDIVRIIPVDNATLPADLIPETVPAVNNKTFLGFYIGGVKAEAGMEITGDTTIAACYVGAEDYSGVWVDSEKKEVVFFNEDKFYVGKSYGDMDSLNFNSETGEMDKPRGYGTGWNLSIAGNVMKVIKTTSEGSVEYNAVKQTEKVEFAGVYVKDTTSKIVIGDGGYALYLEYDKPKFKYTKFYECGGYCGMDCVDDEDTLIIQSARYGDGSYLYIVDSANAGIWVKNSSLELKISGGANEAVYKHNVDGKFVYVFQSKATVCEIVTTDVELTKTANLIVTVTSPDESKKVIKVIEDNSGYFPAYNFITADETRGTYTATFDNDGTPVTSTIVFDGFGNATISENGESEDYSYTINLNNIIVVADSFGIVLKGESFDVIQADGYEGSYRNFNAGSSYYDYFIELDGFGVITAKRGSTIVKTGTYTVDKQANTITVTGISSDDFKDGTYDFMFEKATAHIDGTYWCKNDGNDRFNEIRGKWLNGSSTLEVDSFAGTVKIKLDDTSAESVMVLKYDRSVLQFTVDTVVYTLTIGDVTGGNPTVKITWEGGERVYAPAPMIDEAFFGTWTNDDETIKVVISEDGVTVDFSETSDELVNATLIAANAAENSITVSVGTLNYVLTLNGSELEVTETGDPVATLQKNIIKAEYIGSWKASDESKTYNLVITGKTVTLNGKIATNISQNYGKVGFNVDGVDYKFYPNIGDLDFNGETVKMVDANSGGGGTEPGGDIITNTDMYGTWTWDDAEMTPATGTLVIAANSITFNGAEVENLACEDDRISFSINGNNYLIYRQYSVKPYRLELSSGSYPFANLTKQA